MSYNEGDIKFVKIFIDSQAAISAVGNPYVTSRAVAEAINNLNKLADSVRSVTLVGSQRTKDMWAMNELMSWLRGDPRKRTQPSS